ncbi:MAG: PAS domain S-box protein [Nitrospiraceae bacterium]
MNCFRSLIARESELETGNSASSVSVETAVALAEDASSTTGLRGEGVSRSQTAPEPETEQQAIERDRVRQAYEQASFGLFSNALLGAVLCAVLATEGSPLRSGVWYAVLLGITAARAWLVRRYLSATDAHGGGPCWRRLFAIGATLAGAVWGSSVFVLFPTGSVHHQLFMMVVFSGMVVGGVMSLPAIREAYFGFTFCMLAPLAMRYAFHPSPLSPVIVMVTLLFGGFMLVTSNKQHAIITHTLRLRYENRQLVSSLVQEKRRQEWLNNDLRREVTERQAAQRALYAANEGLEQRVSERTTELTNAVRLLEAEVRERVLAQSALRASEARYRLLYDDTPSMYFTLDADGIILSVNRFGAEQLGYSQEYLVGRSLAELCPEQDRSTLIANLTDSWRSRGAVRHWEVAHVRKDGTVIAVRETARMVPQAGGRAMLLIVCEDITERNRLETQFRQAQKMEAIGKLTGGIAHDFNNLLTVIRGYTDLSREELDRTAPARVQLDAIGQAVDRATTLTQQLLTFSRQQVVRTSVVDLNVVVRQVEDMLRRVIGAHIEFQVRLADGSACIVADVGQMEQVLMNLVVNASDAMPAGGLLSIEVGRAYRATPEEVPGASLPAGPLITLTVRDTGCGMDAETQARAFEPFFTTKPVGKGTGLGLSTVYGIVRQSGGHIAITSQVGRGTAFCVTFPQVPEGECEECGAEDTVERPVGQERVLVVEDDAMVRRLAVEVLQASGYQVTDAASGAEALTILDREAASITLVVTDMVMPGMNGRELIEQIQQRYPALKMLVMSGYTQEEANRQRIVDSAIPFLQKPFTPMRLARIVRDTLDGQVSEVLI